MTRREALKLLQIDEPYPTQIQVQKKYKQLKCIYNPERYSEKEKDIYAELLKQLVQAYNKIQKDDLYEDFNDDVFDFNERDTQYSDYSFYTSYKLNDVFKAKGLIGISKYFYYNFRFLVSKLLPFKKKEI